MSTENNKEKTSEISSIDVTKLAKRLWAHKMLYLNILPIVLIGTYLLTLCVPRYYTCKMELAPESQAGSTSTSISSLASSFGLGGLSKLGQGEDAISPLLYPDLIGSPNFIVTMFSINVKTKDGKVNTTYYNYMDKYQKMAVWDKYLFGPIKHLFEHKENIKNSSVTISNVRALNKHQQEVVGNIMSKIKCNIDKKTDAINITVTDQDPLVCAIIGDSVLARIQSFLIDYRTKKARNDYAYYKRLCDEAKAKYECMRQKYASASDANTDVTLRSVSLKIDDMENEMQLLYNTYSALATQTQAAQAKIQENTPAFTPISTAMIPTKPAGPKRMFISIFVTFCAFLGTSIYILTKSANKGIK